MPGFGRAISDTCDGEKEKCKGGGGGGGGVMPNTAKMHPFMSVMKNKLFSDFFSFKLLFVSISEHTLLI